MAAAVLAERMELEERRGSHFLWKCLKVNIAVFFSQVLSWRQEQGCHHGGSQHVAVPNTSPTCAVVLRVTMMALSKMRLLVHRLPIHLHHARQD